MVDCCGYGCGELPLILRGTPLVFAISSILVWNALDGKMELSCRLQAAGQWRRRVRYPLARVIHPVRGEPEPFVPVS